MPAPSRSRASIAPPGPLFALFLFACGGGPPVEDVQSLSEPLEQCATGWVEGVDVSDAQGAIDWAAVRAAGVRFAFVKATQGTYDAQSTFAANWQGPKAAGVLRGAYHFFDPTEDGAAQAAHFLEILGPVQAGDLPPMLDLECPDGDPGCVYAGRSGQVDPSLLRARVDAFLAAVEARAGTKPILYTFPSYFAASGVDAGGLEVYPLFVANVGASGAALAGSCLAVPAPWAAAALWQYTWKRSVSGVAGDVDGDRFLGDGAGLAKLAGIVPGCP
jgi:lysozyme